MIRDYLPPCGHHRLQQQIADEFNEGHPLGVRHFLELIADMIVHPYNLG